MSEKTCKNVRLYYGLVFSILTVITGALFIWQVLHIYFSGTAADYTGAHVFTRQRVATALKTVLPAIILWILGVIGGAVVWKVFPVAKKKGAYKDDRYALRRLNKRITLSKQPEDSLSVSYNFIVKERRITGILWLVCAAFGVAAAIYTIVYLATPSHFTTSSAATHEIVAMMAHILPFILAAFLLCCAAAVYEGISAKRQLPEARKLAAAKITAPATGVKAMLLKVKVVTGHKFFMPCVRIAIGCIAVAFIIAGMTNGSMHSVLVKAINICTECIGLG